MDISDSPYVHLGCWKDSIPRALPSFEGTSPTLDGHYKRRERAFQKCFELAKSLNHKIFAVQDGGQCFASKNAKAEALKYGESPNCKDDGKGGPLASAVYEILF